MCPHLSSVKPIKIDTLAIKLLRVYMLQWWHIQWWYQPWCWPSFASRMYPKEPLPMNRRSTQCSVASRIRHLQSWWSWMRWSGHIPGVHLLQKAAAPICWGTFLAAYIYKRYQDFQDRPLHLLNLNLLATSLSHSWLHRKSETCIDLSRLCFWHKLLSCG